MSYRGFQKLSLVRGQTSSSVALRNPNFIPTLGIKLSLCRGADKSLDRPGRKQATATEDFDIHISYL